MKSLLTLFIITLLFSGCSSNNEPLVSTPKPLPSWYTNPPQSDEAFLYEVAEGHDKKEAIANALALLAATLSVTVSSEHHSKTTTSTGRDKRYQQDITDKVKTEVKPIHISNYTVLESRQQSFRRYLVLIKSDKKVLFNSLKSALDETLLRLQAQESNIGNKNVLEQLAFYSDAKESYATLQQTLKVMHVLNADFDGTPYIEQAQHYTKRYNDLRANITFSFTSNKDAEQLLPVLTAGLNKEGMSIQNRDDAYHLSISVNSSVEEVKSMGFDLARAAITIQVQDQKKSILGSNKLNITGQSTQGYKVARENVAIKLQRLVDEQGIERLLGVKF